MRLQDDRVKGNQRDKLEAVAEQGLAKPNGGWSGR